MYTAPALQSFPVPQAFCCAILNVSSGPRAVSVEVRSYASDFVGGGSNSGLGSQQGTQVCVPSFRRGAYCKFEFAGSARSFRAAALYFNEATELYTAAVPAQ
jgi:hypothetical protein